MTLKTCLIAVSALFAVSQTALASPPVGIPPQVDAGAVLSWETHNNQQRHVEDALVSGTSPNGIVVFVTNRATTVTCTVRNSHGQIFLASGTNAQVVKQGLISYCKRTDETNSCAKTATCH